MKGPLNMGGVPILNGMAQWPYIMHAEMPWSFSLANSHSILHHNRISYAMDCKITG